MITPILLVLVSFLVLVFLFQLARGRAITARNLDNPVADIREVDIEAGRGGRLARGRRVVRGCFTVGAHRKRRVPHHADDTQDDHHSHRGPMATRRDSRHSQ